MGDEASNIQFTLVDKGEEFRFQTSHNKYYSLMVLISDQLGLPGFGLCSGMGSCGTCLVEICESKTGKKRPALACETKINDELVNTFVLITVNNY